MREGKKEFSAGPQEPSQAGIVAKMWNYNFSRLFNISIVKEVAVKQWNFFFFFEHPNPFIFFEISVLKASMIQLLQVKGAVN